MKSLLFTESMVGAIAAGRKSMTRRVIVPQPHSEITEVFHGYGPNWLAYIKQKYGQDGEIKCPYGRVGVVVVMLCTWAAHKRYDKVRPTQIPSTAKIWTQFDGAKPEWCGRSRPGRFAPLSLRRFFPKAEITEVRVERVQDISREDAMAEGILEAQDVYGNIGYGVQEDLAYHRHPVAAFRDLWYSINSKRGYGWDKNPFVWCVSFKRLT